VIKSQNFDRRTSRERLFGRIRSIQEDNIEMNLGEMKYKGVGLHLASSEQQQIADFREHWNENSSTIKVEFLDRLSNSIKFPRKVMHHAVSLTQSCKVIYYSILYDGRTIIDKAINLNLVVMSFSLFH
jgi:hypothetical protein